MGTLLVLTVIGSNPLQPTAARPAVATHIPAHAMAMGGSGSRSPPAESRKKLASPTAPSSAHTTPTGLIPPGPARSRTMASPAIATLPPATVSRRGRWPWRSHSQPTTSTTPRYSSSKAMPTGIRATALKKHSCGPAIASRLYAATPRAFRRSSAHRPRSWITAGTVRIAAARPIRASTAVPGLHPEP
jgi:hypothetical protein